MLRVTRYFGLRLLILVPAMFLFAAAGHAQVAPTTIFQLDGTAAENTNYPSCVYGAPCDYWDLLNGDGMGAHPGSPGSSLTRTFISGGGNTYAFMGGGSKDPNLISDWACSESNTPNKDTLTNAYAAAYVDPNSKDQVNVFGADRLNTSGAANIGVWFFQEDVECDQNTGKFTNAHKNGDVLVVSSFTVGGTSSVIAVYEWETSCTTKVPHPIDGQCAAINLMQIYSASSTQTVVCSPTSPYSSGTLSNEPACAMANSGQITVTWPYPAPTIKAQGFFTGGIDITNLIPGSGCFSSFLEDTRTSPSPTSSLKDFLGGKFNVCSLSNVKTCNGFTIVNGGQDFEYAWHGVVKNTGAQPLSNISVTDNLSGATPTNPHLYDTNGDACNPGPAPCSSAAFSKCLGYIGTADANGLCVNPTAVTSLKPEASAIYAVYYDDTTSASVTNKATVSATGISSVQSLGAACEGSASSQVSIKKSCIIPEAPSGSEDTPVNNPLLTLSCSGTGCVVVVPWRARVCNKQGTSALTGITVSDLPTSGIDETITGGTFALAANDCTGQLATSACTTVSGCPGGAAGGYTCSGGSCVTPPDPTGYYTPTGFDSSSDGYTSGRFTFDDTAYVSAATTVIGTQISQISCTGIGGTCYAFDAATCPLCADGTCPDSDDPPPAP